ncbi:MAG TPA: aromatic hydrocarbon degradation protein [Mesorhizobium sp.]
MTSKTNLKQLLASGVAMFVLVGSANAGGFSRGTADTDIIFEDGNFNMRAGVTYVSPERTYTQNGNPALIGTSATADYVIPSAAIKFNLRDDLRCAGTLVDNNGGDLEYAAPTTSGKLREEFTTNEKAVTCGYRFGVGNGNLWVLGGGYVEDFDYGRLNVVPGSLPGSTDPFGNAVLTLKGQKYGFRAGLAYEIPDIALRAQVMYRSGTNYGANGTLNLPTAAVLGSQAQALGTQAQALGAQAQQLGQQAAIAAQQGNLALAQQLATQAQQLGSQAVSLGTQAQGLLAQAADAQAVGLVSSFDAIGTGHLPQSVEVKLQSGIAPGWLGFANVRWTDWSVQQNLLVTSAVAVSDDKYYWTDGWTVTGGVGHAFNDTVSGLVALTYDRGLSTGWDLSSDTWTLSAGGSLKDPIGGELRAGVGLTYITSAAETKYGANPNITDQGDAAVDDGWAYAFNVGYAIKW